MRNGTAVNIDRGSTGEDLPRYWFDIGPDAERNVEIDKFASPEGYVGLLERVERGLNKRPVSVFTIVVRATLSDMTSDREAIETFGRLRAILERARK
jgi:hypothetical protein